MVPRTKKQKARNSAKTNLIIAAAFHGVIALVLVFFAAHEGLLGKQIKKIAVEMVKEKPPEKPKEPEKPKLEPPKLDTPKVVQAPRIEEPKMAPPPPTMAEAPPAAAPPPVDVPSFVFEGGKAVESTSDPVQIYKSLIEYSLRSRWDRPGDIDDHSFEADVEVSVDSTGQIDNPVWKQSSGNKRWDDSVRLALANTRGVDRPPPAHFPSRVVVRFDVAETEAVAQ
jgi:outer membrane biosynthesis protein TonB